MTVIDPLPLMMRYLHGGNPQLTNDEREILLMALYSESLSQADSLANRALAELRKAGSI